MLDYIGTVRVCLLAAHSALQVGAVDLALLIASDALDAAKRTSNRLIRAHCVQVVERTQRLGLAKVEAAGTEYKEPAFAPWLWDYIQSIEKPTDGQPVRPIAALLGMPIPGIKGKLPFKIKGCQAGIGTRGGKSRGTGSGSRLIKYVCQCDRIIRAAGELHATHDTCGTKFIAQ